MRELVVDDLPVAPAGVALLAWIEEQALDWREVSDGDRASAPGTVQKALEMVGSVSVGTLLSWAVEGAHTIADPWRPDAPGDLAEAYRDCEARRPIAEARAEASGIVVRTLPRSLATMPAGSSGLSREETMKLVGVLTRWAAEPEPQAQSGAAGGGRQGSDLIVCPDGKAPEPGMRLLIRALSYR